MGCGFHAEISGIRQFETDSVWKHASQLCAYVFPASLHSPSYFTNGDNRAGLQVGGLCANEAGLPLSLGLAPRGEGIKDQ